MGEPIVLVVRRGADRRFEALKNQSAKLDVKVVWDRRQEARRRRNETSTLDRRRGDRRKPLSTTWDLADFCVAVPSRSTK
jgi:hypothetical protein